MNPIRKTLLGGAMVAAALTGGAIGAGLVGTAGAATTSTTTAPASTPASAPASAPAGPSGSSSGAPGPGGHGPIDWSKGGHQANGKTETLLTGDALAKAEAAAKAAVPGATPQRAETDAEGATYEVHMTKADGSIVTVKLDASFKVTQTIDGMG